MYVNQSLAGQTIQASSNFFRKDYLQTFIAFIEFANYCISLGQFQKKTEETGS
jgi:hypothetical protein